MTRFLALASARLGLGAVCFLTAAYATLNCSTFAFEMFIRPQLFPWITSFVNWHHMWWAAAFLASVPTIWHAFAWCTHGTGRRTLAGWLAVGYVAIGAASTARIMASPALPMLWGGWQAIPVAATASVPLVWLALIDYLGASPMLLQRRWVSKPAARQQRLLAGCAVAGAAGWAVHLVAGLVRTSPPAGEAHVWLLTALWTLVLSMGLSAVAYAVLAAKLAAGSCSHAPWRLHHLITVLVGMGGTGEFLRRAVLPTLSIPPATAAVLAASAAVGLAALVAGIALHLPRARRPRPLAKGTRRPEAAGGRAGILVGLVATPLVGSWLLDVMAPWDWAFVGQRLLVIGEGLLILGLSLKAVPESALRAWSTRRAVIYPTCVLGLLLFYPVGALRLAEWSGDRRLEPAAAFDRYAASMPVFRFAADLLVARPGFDGEYYSYLQVKAARAIGGSQIPATVYPLKGAVPQGGRPDIYLLVLDSLRRDYLSPYNSAVSYSPHIGRFAADSFVFRNGYTRHGATQLAAPSIWAGAAVVRGVLAPGFERLNALEAFVNAEGYRIVINDFTVASYLRPTTPSTFLDPSIPSVETDLCQNVHSLLAHLDSSAGDPRPVLTYLSPMNLHILNTRGGGGRSTGSGPREAFQPYASAVRRLDACFGEFVDALKARGRYDKSVIVITSDHGDSLGEHGYWGHATWIFPEVVRVPLIVHLPAALRDESTTDLARLSFTADLVPTFYRLMGHDLSDIDEPFGAPLFAPKEGALIDRRRRSYLLTSSYGAAFGLLRRNGREYYVTDLVERREFAYDMTEGLLGTSTYLPRDSRGLNQRLIRQRIEDIGAFYQGCK